MKTTGKTLSTLLLGAILAAGCATLPPPEPEDVRTEALGADALPEAWAGGQPGAEEIRDGWLGTFQDPQLEAFVTEALANNPDLRAAASKLERSAAYIGVARGALYPQLGVKAQGSTKVGESADSAMNGVVLGASWEIDLWGRVRYDRDAAIESFNAVQYDYVWARHSIAAATASSWFFATETLLEKRAAERMVRDAEELYELAKTRFRVGIADERDVVAAEASITAYQDNLVRLTLAHENALRALEVLIGRYPAADIQPREDLPPIPDAVPAGIPLNALERRPDIYAAERRVAEAFNRVGEAKAAQLPRISLTASGGAIDSRIIELVPSFDNPFASLGAGIIAPLFLGGRLAAQVDVRTAEQRIAIANYARAALQAVYEVESALAAEVNLRDREQILQTNVKQNERSLELETIAFQVGKSDMRRVLNQQLALNGARMSLIRVQSERLTQRVNLHLALGGSFEVLPDAEEPAAEQAAESTTR